MTADKLFEKEGFEIRLDNENIITYSRFYQKGCTDVVFFKKEKGYSIFTVDTFVPLVGKNLHNAINKKIEELGLYEGENKNVN